MPSRRRQQGEGSLFRRSRDGRWVATVNDGWRDGKRDRRLFTGRTPEIALKKRTAFLRARDEGFDLPRGRPYTVDEWLLHWLENTARPTVEATTWERSYRPKVRQLIVPFFTGIPLPQLREEDVERWHRHLQVKVSGRTGEPVSASTIGQAHRIMSAALKVAVQRGKMPRNPCSFVTPPRVDRAEVEPPSAEEIALIVARCRTWPNGARWVLAISTGLRQGEALALRWRDLRLDDPASMVIGRTAARVDHKLVYKQPKSVKSRRTVELPAAAADALREHRRAQPVTELGGLVFVTGRGKPWHPRQDYQDWQDLLADLGLPHYRVHDLRHAAATLLLEGGEDVRVVQELLGHATPAFTQAAYQHVRPVLKRRAADTMDRLLRGS